MYSIVRKEGKYVVHEEASSLDVGVYDTHREAKNLSNKLKGGQGFNGFTPSFFLEPFKVTYN